MPRIVMTFLIALAALPAFAQDGGTAPISLSNSSATLTEAEAIRRDLDAARREVKEMREEMRAQLATQSVSQGWQEDWVDEKRKLELVTFDGYLRVRPEMFYKFNLNRPADVAGYTLWPSSPLSAAERTNAGVNMRFRFEPTINISEEVRIRGQIDALDNLVWGSTPDYAFSRGGANGNSYWYDRNEFSVLSASQAPQQAGINSLSGSVNVKRLWGEVETPVGILRFGRMGSHWGLGMLHNDGNGLDNDWGDTVDRVMFNAEPLPGFYVTPMLDFNVESILSPRMPSGGQQFDLSNSDDSHSFILAVARRDTDTERLAKLDNNDTVFNYGLHFTYRVQRNDSIDYLSKPLGQDSPVTVNDGQASGSTVGSGFVQRDAKLFMPDLWAKIEKKNWRIEAEFASVLGFITNRALSGGDASTIQNQRLDVWQFAAVVQGEYKLLNGDLELGAEVGFASGDKAPGFGNYPRRTQKLNPDQTQVAGVIDGPQYNCTPSGCVDNTLRAFRFNRDYRVDMILYREILGGITDSFYIKPRASYRITTGFHAFAALIYSRAIYAESTPGSSTGTLDPNLGVELNGGARFETEDGFFAQVQYGILFPLAGFAALDPANPTVNKALDFAQAVRGTFGIRF